MESKTLEYSTSNIPLSNKNTYIKDLIHKTEHFVRRLRWKVFHFLNKSSEKENQSNDKENKAKNKENNTNDEENKSNFGFRSKASPPKNALIYEFENDLYDLIQNVEFKVVKNDFQRQMQSDLHSIKTSKKVFVKADKTKNLYGLRTRTI